MSEPKETPKLSQIIIEGFGEDCESFINQYLEKNTIRLKEFIELWKTNKFDLIYSGKKSVAELLEFTDEIFMYTGNLFFSSTCHQSRITLLYLIYCLWHSRPVGSVPSIKVTSSKIIILSELQKVARNEEHYDILYVLCSLLRDGVFRFLAVERDRGLERYYKKYFEDKCDDNESDKEENVPVEELTSLLNPENDVNLSEIINLSEEYNDMKKRLSGKSGHKGEMKKNLNMANFKKICEMQEALNNFGDIDQKDKSSPAKKSSKSKNRRGPGTSNSSSTQKKIEKNIFHNYTEDD